MVAVLCAQAAWTTATTSAVFDENVYLTLAANAAARGDISEWAQLGVAPLPVFLEYTLPTAAGRGFAESIVLARACAIVLIGVPLVFVLYWWLAREIDRPTAAGAAALLALSPNIVAHASLATTDAAFVLFAFVALATLRTWVDMPSRRALAWLIAGTAAAFAAKYSAIGLLAVIPLAIVAARVRGPAGRGAARRALIEACAVTALLVATTFVLLWALHGFTSAVAGPFGRMTMPGPLAGIVFQFKHQRGGHFAFLLGMRSTTGWWYYMPIALLLKSTPAELLVFAGSLAALAVGWRACSSSGLVWRLAYLVYGGLSFVNRVDSGIRYVLVLMPLALCVAVEQASRLPANRRRLWTAAAVLVAMQAVSSAAVAPRYLSYFNALAGGPSQGYRYLADSNVDWGQDLPALRDTLTRVGARRTLFAYFGTAPLEAYGVPATLWPPGQPLATRSFDWIAISVTLLNDVYGGNAFEPFRAIAPSARAGDSIMLYEMRRPEVREAFEIAAARRAP